MTSEIPNPVRAVVSEVLADRYTHSDLNTLFMESGAPGDPPGGNKVVKCSAWLHRCNADPAVDALAVLGKILENFMDLDLSDLYLARESWESARARLTAVLSKHGLSYRAGSIYGARHAIPVRTLADILKRRDLPGMTQEFDRAVAAIETDPPAAVTAACSILEALFKTYIEDRRLELPGDQTLKPLFRVVAADLHFDPKDMQDEDLKRIVSGLFSVVDGIGSLRTHSGSAHGRGRRGYRVEPRHARLAVHGAHTLAVFLLESWEARDGT